MGRYSYGKTGVFSANPVGNLFRRRDDPGDRSVAGRLQFGRTFGQFDPATELLDVSGDEHQAQCRIAVLDCQHAANGCKVVGQATEPEDSLGWIGDNAATSKDTCCSL